MTNEFVPTKLRCRLLQIFVLFLFSSCLWLIPHLVDFSFWWTPSFFTNGRSDYRQTVRVDGYHYDRDKPIQFGGIADQQNGYFRLIVRFKVSDASGYPNVFQTAPGNAGVRMEISDALAAIIIADLKAPNGVSVLPISTNIEKGRWYKLEVEGLRGNFVRANLDAHPVILEVGSRLDFDLSDFVVGSGFDNDRAFRGDIENISLTKGNLSDLPRAGLTVAYSALVLLFFSFLLSLYFMLEPWPKVQLLAGKLSILALPLLLLLANYEYRLSSMNTIYYSKRVEVERQRRDTEVLVVGSSNTFYGVATEEFRWPGFNLAFPGHSMYLDARLIEKYAPKLPRLRMLVLTVNYFTLGTDHADIKEFPQQWRQFFIRQNFDVRTEMTRGAPIDWSFFDNPLNFSKIAIYGNSVANYARGDYRAPVDVIGSAQGWFDAGDVPLDSAHDFGAAIAQSHQSTTLASVDRNLGYLTDEVERLEGSGVVVVLVMLPTVASYYNSLDPIKKGIIDNKLSKFARSHKIKYYDFLKDERFTTNDFTWELPDHLNGKGARKFSRILNDEVLAREMPQVSGMLNHTTSH